MIVIRTMIIIILKITIIITLIVHATKFPCIYH